MGLGFDPAFQHQLARESWPLYGVGMGFIALRTFARVHRVGIRHFYPDDYLMLLVACWYTMLVVLLNVIVQGGGSNLFPPEQFKTFTQHDIEERVKGSKLVLVSEQAMLNVIYTIKACMLIMYSRLTTGLKQHLFLKAIAIYVACGWVATQLAFFLACRPFNGYWAVPPPNPQCTTLENYAITQATFNISSDLMMIAVMLPLFVTMKLPWAQKISLIAVFSLGIFVIVAAILNKVFNLTDVYSTVYMLWYMRESSTAVYVSNIPLIWPLLREWFPYLKHLTPGQAIYKSPTDTPGKSPLSTKDHAMGSLNKPEIPKAGNSTGTSSNVTPEQQDRGETVFPGKLKITFAGGNNEKGVDSDEDSSQEKDLERGVGAADRQRRDTDWDFIAAMEAFNGRGRLHGQSWSRK